MGCRVRRTCAGGRVIPGPDTCTPAQTVRAQGRSDLAVFSRCSRECMVSDRDQSRVTVGCYLDPITPLWATRANVASARLMGADDIWVGDHVRSVFPSTAWNPKLSPMARFIPSLDAYLDPTVVIARWAGRLGITMGMSVTDAIRRTPADLARVDRRLHHMTRGHAVLRNRIPANTRTSCRTGSPWSGASVGSIDTLCAIREAWESRG